jgi:eukaryotic-like serine/threonine-protein kinase
MDTVRETEVDPSLGRSIRQSVGRFRLIERLGAGGMGEVFVAFDPQLEREVAVKLLKLSSAGGQAEIDRLLREANAMAKISHPNVVAVFDAGVDEGRPWVAMELIRGSTLREWLAQKRTWQDTLRVLCQIARGLEAAHLAGLVHRDVKPENVLMGSDGRVAVTDFGIAQSAWTAPKPELATPSAPFSVMGTPGYMAPEQYQLHATDERTDQFAFAVTAYEALWGSLPYERQTGDLKASAELVATTLPKPPPSKGAPAALWRVLKRALQPKSEQRYASMGELLIALERQLPTRTPRWPIALVITVPLAVAFAFKPAAVDPCAGAAARLEQAWSPARQETIAASFANTKLAYADDAWSAAKTGLEQYSQRWQTMYAETCRATRVEGRQSEALLDLRMACLERNRSVLVALSDLWTAQLTPDVVRAATDAVRGLPPLEACADLRGLTERSPLPSDPTAVAAIAAARAQIDQATALNLADRRTDAKVAAAEARAKAEATKWDQVRAEAALVEGEVFAELEVAKAEPTLLEAARLAGASRDDRLAASALIELVHHLAEDKQNAARALLVADLAEGVLLRAGDDPKLRARLTRYRGTALLGQGSYAEAKVTFTTATELARKGYGQDDWEVTANLAELARVAEAQGDTAQARKLGEEVLAAALVRFGPNNPTVAAVLNNLAMAVDNGGDPEAAVAYHRRALAIKEKATGLNSVTVATSLNNLAIILIQLGQLDEGQQMLERALIIREKELGPEHPFVATTLGNLATALRKRGEFTKAIELLERSLAIKTKAYGPVHANVANSLAELGHTWSASGNEQVALGFYQRTFDVRTKALGPAHQQTLHASNLIASTLVELGRCVEARPMLTANVTALEKIEGGKVTALAEALSLIAECELNAGHAAQANELLERSVALSESLHVSDRDLGGVHWGLGRARWALGQKAAALEAVQKAERELAADASAASTLSEVRAWLKLHPH